MIKAVVFDLDDTLYPEYDYVLSGFGAAGDTAQKQYGIAGAKDELAALFAQSRDKVFDRFAQNHGLDRACVDSMVEVYRTHTPNLVLSDEVRQTLIELRNRGYKLGIITDGRPNGQRAKIDALGLNELVDEIIITDELGTDCRKPNPKAFTVMAEHLGVTLDQMLYVGDNPQKDFVIGKHGVKTVRIGNNGMYADSPYAEGIAADAVAKDITEVLRHAEEWND
ncbi:MAG: HAD-IA family hydrolase [Clostridiales bacterium]|nr:HAD-IA family hydrolase [Clostridiales bacterium]